MSTRIVGGVLFFLILGMVVFFYEPRLALDITEIEKDIQATVIESQQTEKPHNAEIVFVGDIMLGRHVEAVIQERGIGYPFQNIRTFIQDPDLTVGNFEGVISESHIQAKPMTFQFSIRNEYLTYLKKIGFDILSLANNHSNDYGNEAFLYTRKICKELRIICGGSSSMIDEYTTHIRDIGSSQLGFVFLHTVFGEPDSETLIPELKKLAEQSDIQVAYVHWGEEYVLTHGAFQERFGKMLIDNGIDVVIGHHPHVVQDVSLYQGKPIFYSLGNFIFDQYFSNEVQEALTVNMELQDKKIIYTLVPLTSSSTQVQPDFMEKQEANKLFKRIMSDIQDEPGVDREKGTITVYTEASTS